MARRRVRPGDRGTKGVFRTSLGKSFEYDSTWERRRMQVLDLNGIAFKREPVGIPYVLDGRKRTYYPDLSIYDRNGKLVRIEEIKPSMRVQDIENMAKFAAAAAWCKLHGVTFLVVTEANLSKID